MKENNQKKNKEKENKSNVGVYRKHDIKETNCKIGI
jgi:hypothetical protein